MKSIKLSALVVGGITIFAGCRHSESEDKAPIPISKINENSVIGLLGVPLGEWVTIQAIIVDGDSLPDKIHGGSYLFRVTSVNGVKLTSEPVLEFSLRHVFADDLAEDNVGLYLEKYGTEPEGLSASQIESLKVGYVGKSVSLQVYETGGFSGMPESLPEDALIWQDHGFCFKTHLVVVKQIETK
jgi:hypothetical protein